MDLLKIVRWFPLKHAAASDALQNGACFEFSLQQIGLDHFNLLNTLSRICRKRNICFTNADCNPDEIVIYARRFGEIREDSVKKAWRKVWRNAIARKARAGQEIEWEDIKVV